MVASEAEEEVVVPTIIALGRGMADLAVVGAAVEIG